MALAVVLRVVTQGHLHLQYCDPSARRSHGRSDGGVGEVLVGDRDAYAQVATRSREVEVQLLTDVLPSFERCQTRCTLTIH